MGIRMTQSLLPFLNFLEEIVHSAAILKWARHRHYHTVGSFESNFVAYVFQSHCDVLKS